MTTSTSQPENYDIVILGREAGKFIARTSAKKEKKAVVIERKCLHHSHRHDVDRLLRR
jgi:hypothetical protein